MRADANSRLKLFCEQKNINLILNEEHLGTNKLHLDRMGNRVSIATYSDDKKTLKNNRISNINKLIFGHLNINSLRNKFDLLCEQINYRKLSLTTVKVNF